jgi:hypothetical protein
MASDLELLLAAPIPASDIFWLKLLTAMWQNVVPALIPVTVLLAYGVAAGAGIGYFVATALVLLVMLAILAGASLVAVMLLMRVVPARRAREVYSLLYVIFFAAGWLGWMFISRAGTSRAGTAGQIMRFGPQVVTASSHLAFPPASWAGSMMLSVARHDWGPATYNALLLGLLAAALVGLAAWLFERSFHRDWAMMHEVAAQAHEKTPTAEGATRRPISLGQRLAVWLPWPARELAGKDWLILPRDLRQLGRLIMPLVVSLFYVYEFGIASPIPRSLPGLGFWVELAISPLVPIFFALALGAPAIGKEGSNYELLRVAPVPAGAMLWGKMMMSAVPTFLMAAVVTLGVAPLLHVAPGQVAVLLVIVCVLSAAISAIAVAFGALVPNFHSIDYRRAAGPLAAYGTMLGGAVAGAAAVGTVAVIAFHLPGNQALLAGLSRGRAGSNLAGLLGSPWLLLAMLAIDGLALGGLLALWRLATARIEAWQPGE